MIKQDGNLDEIWRQLDAHFGNEHHVIDATIKAFFKLPKPTKDIKKFEEYFIQSKNRCASLIALDHEPDQLLAAYFMLQIPGEYRSELEKKLTATNARKTKYTFAELSPLVEEFVRIMKMATEDKEKEEITTKARTLVANTKYEADKQENEENTNPHQYDIEKQQATDNSTPVWGMIGQTEQPQYNRGRGFRENTGYNYNNRRGQEYNNYNRGRGQEYNNYSRGRGQEYNYYRGRGYENYNRGYNRRGTYKPWNNSPAVNCPLCDRNHLIVYCDEYKPGEEMRKKLKELNRCDACLVEKDQHGAKCETVYPCKYCRSKEHETITCDGKNHPGSWIKKR